MGKLFQDTRVQGFVLAHGYMGKKSLEISMTGVSGAVDVSSAQKPMIQHSHLRTTFRTDKWVYFVYLFYQSGPGLFRLLFR